MAVLKQGDLRINGKVVAYEGNVKITAGSPTITPNPQVNGTIKYTEDISTNFSSISVPIRTDATSKKLVREFLNNGDNNLITFRAASFSRCVLTVLPEEEDNQVVEYVFNGNPEV